MGEAARGSIEFHAIGMTGEFVSPNGLKGFFLFPRHAATKGAVVTTTELVGSVRREGDTFHFEMEDQQRFTLEVVRTESGRLTPPSTLWPGDFIGPAGC